MSRKSKTWENLKSAYLSEASKALSKTPPSQAKQILEDVAIHLDRRFDELATDEQEWENFQKIITDMGPPSDYAELLDSPEKAIHTGLSKKMKYAITAIVLVTVVVVAQFFAMNLMQSPVAYIVSFKPISPFEPTTPRQLLEAFNNRHSNGVKTSYFRTEVEAEKLIGHICVNTKQDANLLKNALKQNAKLKLIGVRAVDEKDFEKYKATKQVSLKKDYIIPKTSIINEQGRIVDKTDYPFVNDPQVVGTWKSVDFVRNIEDFRPGIKPGQMDLYLKELIILKNGRTSKPWWNWTNGLIIHSGDKITSKYLIKKIDGSDYMFFEWKSGDYTIRHQKPAYYVLRKVPQKNTPAITDKQK